MSRMIGVILLSTLMLLVTACIEEEPQGPAQVVSEEVVFVSGQTAILTGRVLSKGEVFGSDHGFEISENEDFSDALVISLGEINIPGRFIGQTDQLNIQKSYVARSFLVEDGEIVYGNILSFTTLKPLLVSYEPKVAAEGNEIIISGTSFTNDTKVFFGDREITDFTLTDESIISFLVPKLEDEYLIDISLISQGETLVFDEAFEYIIGTWDFEGYFEDAEFPEGKTNRYFDINYLNNDSDFLVFNGYLGTSEVNETVYNIDLQNFDWDILAFDGDHTIGAFQAYPYFGMGSRQRVTPNSVQLFLSDKIYIYQDDSIELLTVAPDSLYSPVCNKIENKLHIYGGLNSSAVKSRWIFVYDLDSDTWIRDQLSPIDINNDLPNWSYNGNSYFITEIGEVWEHDVMMDAWSMVSHYPGKIGDRGFTTILEDRVFVGMFDGTVDIYELDANTFKWRTKNRLAGGFNNSTNAMWTHNDKIYVMRNIKDEALSIFSLNPDNF